MGFEVAKARLAAKPIVAKPNVDCIWFDKKSGNFWDPPKKWLFGIEFYFVP